MGEQTEQLYGVKVEQVKLTDTAEAVARVRAEKAAGKDKGGSVDLIWINGPNFAAMKAEGLLHGPFMAECRMRAIWTSRPARRPPLTSPCRSMAWKAPGGWRSSSSSMTAPASPNRPRPLPPLPTGPRRTPAA